MLCSFWSSSHRSSILWPLLGQRTRDRIWDKPCETESGTEFFRERLRNRAARITTHVIAVPPPTPRVVTV
ncbi:hypothetical protein J6590_032893, partial [Homalodisca vitripennis]